MVHDKKALSKMGNLLSTSVSVTIEKQTIIYFIVASIVLTLGLATMSHFFAKAIK